MRVNVAVQEIYPVYYICFDDRHEGRMEQEVPVDIVEDLLLSRIAFDAAQQRYDDYMQHRGGTWQK